jgi:hypothetical protein
LHPIGSSCIKRFKRDDLNEYTTIMEKLYKLLHAYEERERIELDSKYFSRKLIEYLFEEAVFTPDKYNGFDSEKDYVFMINMFNKAARGNITSAQQSKINGIIGFKIIPYLKERLKTIKVI